MSLVISTFGVAIVAMGALGVASPGALATFARRWQTPLGMWTAAVLRVGLGVALWVAAPSSRTPAVFQFLGVLSIVSGVVLPFLGLSRVAAILTWWTGRSPVFQRTWAGAAVAFGGFLLWASTV